MEKHFQLTDNIIECLMEMKNDIDKTEVTNEKLMINVGLFLTGIFEKERSHENEEPKTKIWEFSQIDEGTPAKSQKEELPSNPGCFYFPLSRISYTVDNKGEEKFHKIYKFGSSNCCSTNNSFNNDSIENSYSDLNNLDFSDIEKDDEAKFEYDLEFCQIPIQPFENSSEVDREITALVDKLENFEENREVNAEDTNSGDVRQNKIENISNIKSDNSFAKSKNGNITNDTSFSDKASPTEGIKPNTTLNSINEDERKIENDFGLKPKTFQSFMKRMNMIYLSNLYYHFQSLLSQSINPISIIGENFNKMMFVKLYKKFLLALGVSNKRVYDEAIRILAYCKKDFVFEDFLNSCNPILRLTSKDGIVKMKFLLGILKKSPNQRFITHVEIKEFYEMINCKEVKEKEICRIITRELVKRYKENYFSREKENIMNGLYDFKKLDTIIDTIYFS